MKDFWTEKENILKSYLDLIKKDNPNYFVRHEKLRIFRECKKEHYKDIAGRNKLAKINLAMAKSIQRTKDMSDVMRAEAIAFDNGYKYARTEFLDELYKHMLTISNYIITCTEHNFNRNSVNGILFNEFMIFKKHLNSRTDCLTNKDKVQTGKNIGDNDKPRNQQGKEGVFLDKKISKTAPVSNSIEPSCKKCGHTKFYHVKSGCFASVDNEICKCKKYKEYPHHADN